MKMIIIMGMMVKKTMVEMRMRRMMKRMKRRMRIMKEKEKKKEEEAKQKKDGVTMESMTKMGVTQVMLR